MRSVEGLNRVCLFRTQPAGSMTQCSWGSADWVSVNCFDLFGDDYRSHSTRSPYRMLTWGLRMYNMGINLG